MRRELEFGDQRAAIGDSARSTLASAAAYHEPRPQARGRRVGESTIGGGELVAALEVGSGRLDPGRESGQGGAPEQRFCDPI